MDPSYKNFLNWKKSMRGQDFLHARDCEELNKLQFPEVNEIPKTEDNLEELLQDEGEINKLLNQIEEQPIASNEYSIIKDGDTAHPVRQINIHANDNKPNIIPSVSEPPLAKGVSSYRQFPNNNNNSKTEVSSNRSFVKYSHAIQNGNKGTEKPQSLSMSLKKKRNIYFQIISRDNIAIETDFFLEPPLMGIIKEYQGRFDRESRVWYAPYRNYISIFQKLKESQHIGNTNIYPITNLPLEFLCKPPKMTVLKFIDDNKKTYEIDYSADPTHTIFELPGSMLSNLYNFQKIGIEFGIKKNGRILLADEMGVGKTIQAIGMSAVFREDWPVLILCPSSLKFAWRDELLNWLRDIITKKDVQIIKKGKDELNNSAKFYIMSYDLSIRIEEKIKEKNFKFAIADEAHYLKSKDAKRTKLMVPILQKCKRLLLLSGTPILAKPVEIFPLLRALRPDIFTGFKAFGSRYCDPKQTPYGIDWSGSANSKELHFLLSNIMIRRLKKDVLSELPPKKRQKVEIQTDKKILNQIRVLLSKSAKVDFENEKVLLDLDLIINDDTNKIKDDDELSCFTKAYSLTGKAKIPGIKEYVNYLIDNSCKFLIFAHHMEVLDGIEEEVNKCGVKYMRIDGKVSQEKRHENVQRFQKDDSCLVALLAITACATGLTLTKASTVVFAEMHFTPAIMIQAEDRAHRIGQEHNCVNVHYLYAADTVDEIIFNKLREKFFVVSSTLDNKRMDMDVQKLKTGCMGEIVKKKQENDDTKSETSETTLSIISETIRRSSGKKNRTLTDYFKPVVKNDENKVKAVYYEDNVDEILEILEPNELFDKKKDDPGIENEQKDISENDNKYKEINIHECNSKRSREIPREEFSLLSNTSEDEAEGQIQSKMRKISRTLDTFK